MTKSESDDKLGRALRAAAGRDLPGGEFEDRVMRDVAGGGGEREIAAAIPRRPIYWAGVAAAVLIGFFLGATFFRGGDAPGGGGDDMSAAAAPRVALPVAENGVPSPKPVIITITDEGEVWYGGEVRKIPKLASLLAKAAEGTRDEADARGPSLRDVIIRCDVRTRWRVVQWTMQTFAYTSVRMPRVNWAVRGGKVLPVHLPMDRGPNEGLSMGLWGPQADTVRVQLCRATGSSRTELTVNGRGISLEQLGSHAPFVAIPPGRITIHIDASAEVPFGDVVKVVDWARTQSSVSITFTGAPPSGIRVEVKPEIIERKPIEEKPVEEEEWDFKDPVIKDAKVIDENDR